MSSENDGIKWGDLITPDSTIADFISQLQQLQTRLKDVASSLDNANARTASQADSIKELQKSYSATGMAMQNFIKFLSLANKSGAPLQASINGIDKSVLKFSSTLTDLSTRLDGITTRTSDLIKAHKTADASLNKSVNELLSYIDAIKKAETEHAKLISLVKLEQAAQLALKASLPGDEIKRLTLEIKANEATLNRLYFQGLQSSDAFRKLANDTEALRSKQQALRAESKELTKIDKELAMAQVSLSMSMPDDKIRRTIIEAKILELQMRKLRITGREASEEYAALGQRLDGLNARLVKMNAEQSNVAFSSTQMAAAGRGLQFSVSQLIREVPNATLGLRMFFLAISNNLPILVDDIQRFKREQQALTAEGKKSIPVWKAVMQGIVNWQTAIIVLITLLTAYGKEIQEFFSDLIRGSRALTDAELKLEAFTNSIESASKSVGEHMALYRTLQELWARATPEKKASFVEDYAGVFKKLNVELKTAQEAEDYLVANSDNVIEAFMRRGKYLALYSLSSEKYAEAFKKQAELEAKVETGRFSLVNPFFKLIGSEEELSLEQSRKRIEANKEINKLFDEADRLAKMSVDYYDRDYDTDAGKATEQTRKKAEDARKKAEDARKKAEQERERAYKKYLKDLKWFRNEVIKIHKGLYKELVDMQTDHYTKTDLSIEFNAKERLEKYNKQYDDLIKFYEDNRHRLTDEQKKEYEEAKKNLKEAIKYRIMIYENERDINRQERDIRGVQLMRESLPYDETVLQMSLEREEEAKKKLLDIQAAYLRKANDEAREHNEESARDEQDIAAENFLKLRKMRAEYENNRLDIQKRSLKNELELAEKGTNEELSLRLRILEVERQQYLMDNYAKPKAEQEDPRQINAIYGRKRTKLADEFQLSNLESYLAYRKALVELEHSSYKTSLQEKEAESAILGLKIRQMETEEETHSHEYKTLLLRKQYIDEMIKKQKDFLYQVGDKGLGGAIMDSFGFSDGQQDAMETWFDKTIDYLQELIDIEAKLAEQEAQNAEKRVTDAQNALDKEIEARNAGYAHNVAQAKIELENEKRNLRQKQKLAEEAKRKQLAVESVMQASSLVTAAAKIFSEFNIIAAIPLVAVMFGAFAAAKISAYNATKKSSDTYGEGGIEFLEGGSHASGNDIDLHTKNRRGRNMRAEGGEAMIIVNKKATKKYRSILPDLVRSINSGKYIAESEPSLTEQIMLNNNTPINMPSLDSLSRDVSYIKDSLATKQYVTNDAIIIRKGNATRIIHN